MLEFDVLHLGRVPELLLATGNLPMTRLEHLRPHLTVLQHLMGGHDQMVISEAELGVQVHLVKLVKRHAIEFEDQGANNSLFALPVIMQLDDVNLLELAVFLGDGFTFVLDEKEVLTVQVP